MNRSPYISVTAYLVPVIAAFVNGFFIGFAAGALLKSVSFFYPIPGAVIWQTSQTVGSIAAVVAFWIAGIGWWYQSEREDRSFRQALEAAKVPRLKYAPTSPARWLTDGGRSLDALDSPASYSQTRAVAKLAVRVGKYAISNRKLRPWFDDKQTSAYINWLTLKGYVVERNPENANSGVEITDLGMQYFKQKAGEPLVKPHSTSPSGEGWVAFD